MTQQSSRPNGRQDTVTKTETTNVTNPRNFWKTNGLGIVITALGGVIASIVTGTATYLAAQKDKNPLPTFAEKTVTVTAEAPLGVTPETSVAGSTQQVLSDSEVRWNGRFAFTIYPDFESIPPKNNGDTKNYLYASSSEIHLGGSGGGSLWTGPTPPTKKQCSDLIDTQAQAGASTAAGTQICYRTGTGRLIFFTVVSVDRQTGAIDRVQTDLVIWK
ncbi:hypothetical protein [Saccharopolyspora hattusasensis]|uniref:hypothetical protein n=1 Tax=Saccharopolyspora hattusasensis TaxID=1128679 RepID=UPI003D9785D6